MSGTTGWDTGDVSGSTVLTASDHLYEDHINEQRESNPAGKVVGPSANAEYSGTTGTTIQAAIDAAGTAGHVFIKNGTYNLGTTSIQIYPGMRISGESKNGAILSYTGTGYAIERKTGETDMSYAVLENFMIKGANGATDCGIDMEKMMRCSLRDLYLYQCGLKGLRLSGVCYYNTIDNVIVRGSKYGYHVDGDANENKFFGGEVGSILTGGNGIYCDTGNNNLFLGVACETDGETLIYLGPDSYANKVVFCRMEGNGSTGVTIDTADTGSHNLLLHNYYSNDLTKCINNLGTSTTILESTGSSATFGAVLQLVRSLWIKATSPVFNLQDGSGEIFYINKSNAGDVLIQSTSSAQSTRGFQFYTAGTKIFELDKTGALEIKSLADGTAVPNSSLYYSSTQSKLVWKDSGGTVNNLY